MQKELFLLTRNKDKIASAQEVFSPAGITIKGVQKEYLEIQADSSIEIARHAAVLAAKELGAPVIREDHSLFINYFYSFPGPYTSYFDKKIPAQTILKLMEGANDRTGFFEIAAVLAFPDGNLKEFIFKVSIKISTEARGSRGNWDKILLLENEQKTFAELPLGTHKKIFAQNFEQIINYFRSVKI